MPENVTLISTIYAIEPVIVAVTHFSPSRIVLLREEDAPEEKIRSEEMIKTSFGSVLEIETRITSLYDVVRIARDVAGIIEEEAARGQRVVVNITGGRKPQAFGALFGAYARKDLVDKVVYVTEEDQTVVDLPLLDFGISETKRMILEAMNEGMRSVSDIALKIGISKGMTYNHIRELKAKGFISDDMRITNAGRLAII
ncbi:MAG TPA: CRISPR locus-related DNA-binding protein [Candidatus Syntrophoarchaeum butanivorans]|uniref:CRISPR locus-related DNA-binding protein n=1 Tax=Candidatus Syntropharchaeum butanivorans TaxID=1839936 RepID=A0A7J2RZJ9_9EURY|nr:MAG: CRISPR locus-related DNA-binding protein [Candidatus Syntrophoarchaeum sp. WYZ-LMO15]HEC56527.1 CRISPR locus-related DNA-binding protein [Candidatus Syntrophoarchaeum butanivorans]